MFGHHPLARYHGVDSQNTSRAEDGNSETAPSISVVIPAYNEESSVANVLAECLVALPRCTGDFDVTVIDDGSTDSTAAAVETIMAKHRDTVRLIRHTERRGFAEACSTAFHAGRKDWVILLHADGQYPPSMLPGCMHLLRDHDAVLFVRRHKYYNPVRGILSWGYRLLPRLLFDTDLKDPGGSKAIRRELIERIPVTSTGIFRDPERILRAIKRGHRIGFLTVDILPRKTGTAMGGRMRQAIEALKDIGNLWWNIRIKRQNF